MSLDVYLSVDSPQPRPAGSGIFVREAGQTKEISQEEWDARSPGREPVRVVTHDEDSTEVYTANITHNLGRMAGEAGLYEHLWCPEELHYTHAHELIPGLQQGLARLQSDPDHFRQFNPRNGWGTYEGLVAFVRNYLRACETYPDAHIQVSR